MTQEQLDLFKLPTGGAAHFRAAAPQIVWGYSGNARSIRVWLARLCQEKLAEDPFSGCVFVFRSRRGTTIRLLSYDGQGYWLAQKRLSKGRFVWWPEGAGTTKPLEAYEAQLLMAAGDLSRVRAAPMWRRVSVLK